MYMYRPNGVKITRNNCIFLVLLLCHKLSSMNIRKSTAISIICYYKRAMKEVAGNPAKRRVSRYYLDFARLAGNPASHVL